MKIGFFDSGLGGLTVLKEAIDNEALSEDIYYLADTKNTPYGTKDEEFVHSAIMSNIEYLVSIGCNPIVIACNTATSLCISDLRKKYENIIFIGTEPAVKVAADEKLNKKILVLATSITVKQEKLLNLIDELNIKDEVVLRSADDLVRFAENTDFNNLTQQENEYIKSILIDYDLEKFSHIVLGCTHFPLFKENFKSVIKDICPKAQIQVIDGAKGISKNLIKSINKLSERNEYIPSNKKITIITTSLKDSFTIRSKQILEISDKEVEYKLH